MQDRIVNSPGETTLDVAAIMDSAPLGSIQLRVLVLCALIALLDGYDTLVIGLAAPSLAKHLDLSTSAFGGVFAIGLAGAALGGLIFGPLGDRFGRRPILMVCGLIFAIFCGLTAWVTSFPELLAYRFLTGVGLGGAAPSFVSLATEFAPSRYRSTSVTLIWASLPLGGILGGVLSAATVSTLGWEVLFYFGGIAPLLAIALVWLWLPESPRFLMRTPKGRERLQRILEKIDSVKVPRGTTLGHSQNVPSRGSVAALFNDGRRTRTLLIWGAFCFAAIVPVLVPLWAPTLLQGEGYSTERSSLVVSLFNVGAILGMIVLGFLIDRFGVFVVMSLILISSALSLGMLGEALVQPQLVTILFFIGGMAAGGGAAGIVALTAMMYPTELRSTGIGWAAAFGRVGQMTGPAVSGALIGLGWGAGSIFSSFAVPPFMAALFVIALARRGSATPVEPPAA